MFSGELTERQIGLLNGVIKPEDNEEWNWLQKKANEVVSPPVVPLKSRPEQEESPWWIDV